MLSSLLKPLLCANPAKRLTADAASEQPFFNTVHLHGNQALQVWHREATLMFAVVLREGFGCFYSVHIAGRDLYWRHGAQLIYQYASIYGVVLRAGANYYTDCPWASWRM